MGEWEEAIKDAAHSMRTYVFEGFEGQSEWEVWAQIALSVARKRGWTMPDQVSAERKETEMSEQRETYITDWEGPGPDPLEKLLVNTMPEGVWEVIWTAHRALDEVRRAFGFSEEQSRTNGPGWWVHEAIRQIEKLAAAYADNES